MASDHGSSNMKRVVVALTLTGTFMVVEVIGGILAGSLALLADAGHMLTDTMALALAAVAFHVGRRPADSRRTFGYQRFQILAAFVNGLSLLLITIQHAPMILKRKGRNALIGVITEIVHWVMVRMSKVAGATSDAVSATHRGCT